MEKCPRCGNDSTLKQIGRDRYTCICDNCLNKMINESILPVKDFSGKEIIPDKNGVYHSDSGISFKLKDLKIF